MLDPELRDAALGQPYVAFTDPLAARRNFRRATRLSRALRAAYPATGIEIDDVWVPILDGPKLSVRRYAPAVVAQPLPALVYLHGGAFVAGDLDTEHDRCVRYAAEVGCAVFSVQYRQPPEHPFPTPLHDCYVAVEWIASGADGVGVDPGRIAVGGSSAGATLATGVALLARDRGGPALALQLLLYPALDNRLDSRSMGLFPEVTSWTVADSALMWQHYLGPGGASDATHAVPARSTDFRGVAPAYVLIADVDALRDEALDYAGRMIEDEVPVDLHLVAGTFHGFDVAVPGATVSVRSLDDQVRALRAALGTGA